MTIQVIIDKSHLAKLLAFEDVEVFCSEKLTIGQEIEFITGSHQGICVVTSSAYTGLVGTREAEAYKVRLVSTAC